MADACDFKPSACDVPCCQTPDEDDTEDEPEKEALLENKAGSGISAQGGTATGSGNGLRWI